MKFNTLYRLIVDNYNYNIYHKIANDISKRIQCNKSGSCMFFAYQFTKRCVRYNYENFKIISEKSAYLIVQFYYH